VKLIAFKVLWLKTTQAARRQNMEEITAMGGRVSLDIGELAGTHHASVDDILQELVVHERGGIDLYRRLLKLSEGWSISLEEFARAQVRGEEMHLAEIDKMLRRRGDA
jgi:bacterioferritin